MRPSRALLAALGCVALLIAAPAAHASLGNPNYRSVVTSVTPPVKGFNLSVLDFDDRLSVQNVSGKTITVLDYQNKPYVRLLADGKVELNTNSEAYYLNANRLGTAPVPPGLGPNPKWKLIARTGRYNWHDHRIHWMATTNPPEVKNTSKRTLIDDWRVPILVNGRAGHIDGTLTWVGQPQASLPLGAIFAFAALVIVLALIVFFIRRRRRDGDGGEPTTRGDGSAPSSEEVVEAW